MNKYALLALIPIALLLMIPIASATSPVSAIIETGLPTGTAWSYELNGAIHTTTDSIVTFSSSSDVQVLPLTGYNITASTVSGNYLYVTFSSNTNTPTSLAPLIPYLSVLFILGILGLTVTVIIRRRRN